VHVTNCAYDLKRTSVKFANIRNALNSSLVTLISPRLLMYPRKVSSGMGQAMVSMANTRLWLTRNAVLSTFGSTGYLLVYPAS
jgi:hypothetical protein